MLRMKALASGSNGNCIFIDNDDTAILIDAGISCKRITDGIRDLERAPEDLSGILITHEHSDHIQGLKILSKRYGIPLYGTKGTLKAVLKNDRDHVIDQGLLRPVDAGSDFHIGSFDIRSIPVFHDAADPCAYRVNDRAKSVAVMTDTGKWTDSMLHELEGVNGLLLEANHDIRMLEAGPYPYALKRRILSDYGHLSNDASGHFLSGLMHPDLSFVLLGHLSEENNYPDLALMSVKGQIDDSGCGYRSDDFDITVAARTAPSKLYTI